VLRAGSKTEILSRAIEAGYDIRTVRELPGHSDVTTTMIYTHVLNRGGLGVKSPIDGISAPAMAAAPLQRSGGHASRQAGQVELRETHGDKGR
jgi:hypothetical protein